MNTQQLRELAQRATPWPWKWFTSNSHNRLSSAPSGKDGDVISAFKAVDRVSCVSVSRADMAFIEASHPGAVLELIDRIEAAERERDELRESLAVMDGHLSASRALKQLWKNRAWDAEEEIARRDAAAGEAVHLYREYNPCNGMKTDWIEIDSEQLASLKESTDPETAEFRTLQEAAPPAVLPPEKPVHTDLSRTDIMKNIAYNQALNDVKELGAQPQKPVVLARDLAVGEKAHQSHVDYAEGYNDRAQMDRAALDAANIRYEVKK